MRDARRNRIVVGGSLNAGVVHGAAGAGHERPQAERIGGIAGGLHAEYFAARVGEGQRPSGRAADGDPGGLQLGVAVDLRGKVGNGQRRGGGSRIQRDIHRSRQATPGDPDGDVGGHEQVAGSSRRNALHRGGESRAGGAGQIAHEGIGHHVARLHLEWSIGRSERQLLAVVRRRHNAGFLKAAAAGVVPLAATWMAALMEAARPSSVVTPCRLTETLTWLPSEKPGPENRNPCNSGSRWC